MNRQTRFQAIAASVILSGLILSHEVQAREWLLAQARPQSQPNPGQAQPSPGQSSSGQSSPGQSSPGQSTLSQPGFGQPASGQPASGRSTLRRQNPFNRYSTQRNAERRRFINPVTGRTRRIPLEPVPMPDERRTPIDLEPPKTLPRIPDSFASPSTGIMAQVVVTPICSIASSTSNCIARPYQGELRVMSISGDRQFRVSTDLQGQLQLRLDPGVYVIRPNAPEFPSGSSQTVTVIDGMMRSLRLEFQSSAQPVPSQLPGQASGQLSGQTSGQLLGQPPGQSLPQQPIRPPASTWQPSLVPQPLYPPMGQF